MVFKITDGNPIQAKVQILVVVTNGAPCQVKHANLSRTTMVDAVRYRCFTFIMMESIFSCSRAGTTLVSEQNLIRTIVAGSTHRVGDSELPMVDFLSPFKFQNSSSSCLQMLLILWKSPEHTVLASTFQPCSFVKG